MSLLQQLKEKLPEKKEGSVYEKRHFPRKMWTDIGYNQALKEVEQSLPAMLDVIAEYFTHKGWHEIDCPAHSNQMQKEKDCECLYGFVLSLLTNQNKDE